MYKRQVLIDGGKTFRDFIRVNKDSQKLIKKLIAEVSGVPVPIGPLSLIHISATSAIRSHSVWAATLPTAPSCRV